MINKSVSNNVILNAIRTLSTLFFPLIIFSYASRILLPEYIGRVEFIKNVVMYFTLFASLGINNYGVREASKVRNSRKELSRLFSEIMCINIVSMVLSYLALYFFVDKIVYLQSYQSLLIIFSLNIIFTVIGVEWLFIAMEEYKYITLRTIVCQVFSLLILFLFVKDRNDYIWYAVALLISVAGANLLNCFIVREFIDFRFTISPRHLLNHLKPIFLLFIMVISNNLYSYIDSVNVGFILDDKAVGLYTAALKYNRIIIAILGSIGAVVMPRLSYLWENSDKNKFYELSYAVINIIMMFGLPCCVGACVLSGQIITIFCGNSFSESIHIMRLLSPVIILLSMSTFFNMHVLIPTCNDIRVLISVVVGLFTNVVLVFLLIFKFGLNGVAFATVIGELAVFLVSTYYVKSVLELRIVFRYLLHYIVGSLGVFVVCLCFTRIATNEIIQCSSSILLSVIVYYIVLAKIFKNKYLEETINIVRRKLVLRHKREGYNA